MIKLILLALIVLGVVAVHLLGAWGILAWLAVVIVAYKLMGGVGGILKKVVTGAFQAKSSVLREATATVHAVTAAPPPPPVEGEGEDGGAPRKYFHVDVTIAPKERGGGGFQHWEPGELRLVPIERDVGPDAPRLDDGPDGDVCEVAGLDIHEGNGGGFRPDEDGVKVLGSRRLRLHVGVRPGAPARLKFHYYFEGFGEVRIA